MKNYEKLWKIMKNQENPGKSGGETVNNYETVKNDEKQ